MSPIGNSALSPIPFISPAGEFWLAFYCRGQYIGMIVGGCQKGRRDPFGGAGWPPLTGGRRPPSRWATPNKKTAGPYKDLLKAPRALHAGAFVVRGGKPISLGAVAANRAGAYPLYPACHS